MCVCACVRVCVRACVRACVDTLYSLPTVQYSFQSGLHDVPMVIVGNKCDLNDRRIVPKQNGEKVSSLVLQHRLANT